MSLFLPLRAVLARLVLVSLWGGLGLAVGHAQVKVYIDADRSEYVQYEPIMLRVVLVNTSGTDITFTNQGSTPWLSFIVERTGNGTVSPDLKPTVPELTLKADETKALPVNITPLYNIRETGEYRVRVMIDLGPGSQIVSETYMFYLSKGQLMWTTSRPYNASERTYSLIRFAAGPSNSLLYVRVEDKQENLVYAMRSLGTLADVVEPQVQFDADGMMHVLQIAGMSSYLYSRLTPDGGLDGQTQFDSTGQGIALLRAPEGNVMVTGGVARQKMADRERLSEGQANSSKR